MSNRTAEANKAINDAWKREKELVQNGKGTREWTPEQQQDILSKGRAYDEDGVTFQGQHMRSAEKHPEYQGDPNNIQFLTRAEHLEAHDGNWRNPSNWYFDPFTKEKIDFGDGPIIPCKVIYLADPVVIPKTSGEVSNNDVQETGKDTNNATESNVKSPPASTASQQHEGGNSLAAGIGQKLIGGIKKVGKEIIEFPVKHPKATLAIAAIAAFTSVAAKSSTRGSSGSGSGSSSSGSFDDDIFDNDSIYDEDYDYYEEDEEYEKDDENIEEKDYTPNDVPAGMQHYHYKDGTTKLRGRSAYHRGGDKNE